MEPNREIVDTRPVRGGWLIAHPLPLLLALDASGIALGIATLGQIADPDVLLHAVWIVLALEAFNFGLKTSAFRILVAGLFVFGYAVIADDNHTVLGASLADLDLEEWPLMAAIAVIVAVMADRVTLLGHRYAALYRAASDRLISAQEDERKHLAADLHDGVGQTMTAIALALDEAAADLARPSRPTSTAGEAIGRARGLTAAALEDVRGVAFRLRPARLRAVGVVAALRELAASAGRPVEFTAGPDLARPDLLSPTSEVDVYRIIQEALGNTIRHAGASRVTLAVQRIGKVLRIDLTDDGVGFDPHVAGRDGLGLASMEDRATAIGGTLRVRSQRNRGTLVRLEVPLHAPAVSAPAADAGALAAPKATLR